MAQYQPRAKRIRPPAQVSQQEMDYAKQISEKYIAPIFTGKEDFEIFSSLRFDSKMYNGPVSDLETIASSGNSLPKECFFLVDHHYARLKLSLEYFNWGFDLSQEVLLQKLSAAVSPLDLKNAYKLRILISPVGSVKIETYPVAPVDDLWDGLLPDEDYKSPVYDIYLDPEPVVVSPFTSLKTTKRDHYTSARERCLPGKTPFEDVFLHNTAGQMTESSFCNCAFWVDGNWQTPPLSSGTLIGTVRRQLLQSKDLVENHVLYKDVKPGQKVLIMNAVIGVKKGVVRAA
ncbi:unnamed protein product [Kuraishia capsulata CBS 1993]|uniref:Aminotransferase class IV n=1 Tax=Kuraishia capsulata CBS 1993 TaxID=1382522 RepID=W6MT10_9ASCO|nr:uncharacterized protein KUCA_T00004334001 [Kuraishia capsulata CBS 1993]CDK28352.1 unnamed protein product [Kuraishia capsulata CBS 1993]